MIHPPYDFKSMRANYPKRILFVINLTCATDCFYCYADKRHNYVPMLTGRICELIDEARSIGVVSFDLSGGEVLLHPDWEIILGKLLKHGYKPYVSTKVPVSEDTIKRLKNIGVRKIQISLDSLDPELLANTINVGKSYADNIKETVLTFDRYGFDIVLKSTLTKTTCNRENVRDLLNFAAQFRHVSRYTCSSVGYSHFKGVRAFKEMIPSVAAVKDLESYLTSVKEDYKFEILDDLNAETSACMNDYPSFKKRSFCSGNLTSLIILPDGKVTICEELYWDKNFILGDLTQSSIMEVWRSDRAKYLSRLRPENFPKDSPCATCEDFQNCRNDRGICWKETIAVYGRNNWLFPDPRCPFAPAMINDVYYG
ncbi:MAG: radical SAM protein [Porphyromonadaceae bacterium]|nr:radical SAM protein [Porphyromonadaceae bacterium]